MTLEGLQMHQLRLIIADWLLELAWRLMPDESQEKEVMTRLLKSYLEQSIK